MFPTELIYKQKFLRKPWILVKNLIMSNFSYAIHEYLQKETNGKLLLGRQGWAVWVFQFLYILISSFL